MTIAAPAIDTSSTIEPRSGGLAAVSTGVELYHEVFGDGDETILLVMGLGAQMVGWRLGFVEALVDRGFRVVRFDNRDIGLSTKTDGPPPNPVELMGRAQAGEDISDLTPYSLADMAADAIALLDHLGVDRAHVVGASMGGMIVQEMAIGHAERLRSATSIMSTTGNPEVGGSTPEALEVLLAPAPPDRDAVIAAARNTWKVISGPLFDGDVAAERAAISYDRNFNPLGAAFQLGAIAASGDRTEKLRSVAVPFLVVHGVADTLVGVSGGHATAEAVPGADLAVFADMGHDLPAELWPQITGAIVDKIGRVLAS